MAAADSLPVEFVRLLSDAIGEDNAHVAAKSMELPPSVSIRLNAAKVGNVQDFMVRHFPCHEPIQWNSNGFLLNQRPSFTADPMLHAGAYYVQDSSSMYPGHIFRKLLPARPCPKVLDLCAAPGGKSTDLAASLRAICGDSFLLVANEVMRQRASILAENVARWGDPNVVVTSADASAFASLDGWFDVIVADVPCSGEGMFRKDHEALRQWSMDTVSLCEKRQRRILADVWPALKPGGILIYSTCTFNSMENDGNVEWVCETLGAEPIETEKEFSEIVATRHGHALVPGMVKGEGQFCAAMRKDENGRGASPTAIKRKNATKTCLSPSQESYIKALFSIPVSLRQKGDLVIAVPEAISDAVGELGFLNTLATGTAAGSFKGKDFVPSGDLALSTAISADAFVRVEVDKATALRFLRRDTVILPDAPTGLLLVCNERLPLGFVKNLGRRCNNLLPAGRRIRMDIP